MELDEQLYKRSYELQTLYPEHKAVVYGPVAHLGEHLLCTQGVAGSSPVRSTITEHAN